jgi:hypothetical protein
MVEKLEGRGRACDRPDEEAASGIRENPLPVHLRASERRPVEALAGGRLAEVVARVLSRFDRLSHDEHGAVRATALDGLAAARVPLTEGRVGHAVLAAAISLEQRRWVDEIGVPHGEVARELTRARRRWAALPGREGKVFLTAHQNLSRAWRKICEGSDLASWCGSFRTGHRFVCGPPALDLWEAGRAYMDACNGHGGQGGEAFDAWIKAHEAHNAWFSEWKKQSARAVRRWRTMARVLDASGVRPSAVHAPLVRGCAALGIDRWVVPAKLGQQSWNELLEPAHRPGLAAHGAWVAFLRANGFGPAPEAAFRELERDAALADVASVELEHAYQRLLLAAEQQTGESTSARDAFRALLERGVSP